MKDYRWLEMESDNELLIGKIIFRMFWIELFGVYEWIKVKKINY